MYTWPKYFSVISVDSYEMWHAKKKKKYIYIVLNLFPFDGNPCYRGALNF
mgnify:CR=1 FL=1